MASHVSPISLRRLGRENALAMSVALLGSLVASRLNFFEAFCAFAKRLEVFQVDEIMPASIIFALTAVPLAFRREWQLRASLALLEAEKERESRFARTDALTNLPNRHAFDEALRRKALAGEKVSLFVIDLNGFKALNDEHGHAFGDAVLRQVGERLAAVARLHSDYGVARFGGDEFALIAPMLDKAVLEDLTSALLTALELGTMIDRKAVIVRAAVGHAALDLASFPASDLLRSADAAMYRAKRCGMRSSAI